jgi:hypothetical protein
MIINIQKKYTTNKRNTEMAKKRCRTRTICFISNNYRDSFGYLLWN